MMRRGCMASACRMTSLGKVLIEEDGGQITRLTVSDSSADSRSGTLDEAFSQLDEYLSGRRRAFSLDLRPGTEGFADDVLTALMRVPYGRTVSYRELAEMSGHPGAQRAAGTAVSRNPIAIFIPCHRVIRSDGSIGGYSMGIDIKRRLLELEGVL